MILFQCDKKRLVGFFHHYVRYGLMVICAALMVGGECNSDVAVNTPLQDNIVVATMDVVNASPENNTLPIASAGSAQIVKEDVLVTLDARASKGNISSYQWVQEKHPLGIAVLLSGATTATPTFIAPKLIGLQSTQLLFKLTVTDNEGNTAKDSVLITVEKNADPNEFFSLDGVPDNFAFVHLGFVNSTAEMGVEYKFKPIINGEASNITFSIEEKPKWAKFSEVDGTLSGVPSTEDLGFYPNVKIKGIRRGKTDEIGPFSIEVKVWDRVSFCAGRSQKNGLTYCSANMEKLSSTGSCQIWGDFHSPILEPSSIKLYSATTPQELETLGTAYCHKKEPTYDKVTKTCPTGYQAIDQVIKGAGGRVVYKVSDPLCVAQMTAPQYADKLMNEFEDKLSYYQDEYNKYLNDPEKLQGFTPLQPSFEGPDTQGHLIINLPPPISLQHNLEKQRRQFEQYLSEAERGLHYQDPNTTIGVCPTIDAGQGWNKGVCFTWDRQFGDRSMFSLNTEAMGMLRMSGESLAQLTVSSYILGNPFNIVNLSQQSKVWTIPEQVDKKYFSVVKHSAAETAAKLNQEVDNINSQLTAMQSAVKGSAFKSELGLLANIVRKQEKELSPAGSNLSWNKPLANLAQTLETPPITIPVGAVSISFSAGVGGEMNVNTEGSLTDQLSVKSTGVTADAKLQGKLNTSYALNLNARAGAEMPGLAEMGGYGVLNYMHVDMPLRASVTASELLSGLPPKLELDWQAVMLAGEVGAYAKVNEVVTKLVVKPVVNLWNKLVPKKLEVPEEKIKTIEYRYPLYKTPGVKIGYQAQSRPDLALKSSLLTNDIGYMPIYCSRGPRGCPKSYGSSILVVTE